MIKKKFFVILVSAILSVFEIYLFGGLFKPQYIQEKREKKTEVISLLGKKLYATPAKGEELLKLQDALKEAMKQVKADPKNPENIILHGRRLAYLWKYHEAIEVFSKGIEDYPDYAMLYRHRGHRYISVRKFDKAVSDLTRASKLNDHDFDIWYHLGLAHYLRGEFMEALSAYKNCMKAAEDADSKIAISNWLYITLRRLGKEDEAAQILRGITEEMEVVENQSYYSLLLFFKGRKSEAEIAALAEASDIDLATIGYGIGCWHLYNENIEKARIYFDKIVNTTKYWPAFGFIAAEAELSCVRE